MKLKKLVALGLSLTMAGSLLAGCGGTPTEEGDAAGDASTEAEQVIIYSNADEEAITAMSNALDANGYAIPGKKATGLTAAGRAEETVENKGADGEAFIRVARGVFVFNNTATTSNKIGAAHVLKPCYIEDDQTVTALATGASAAGLVVRVDEDGVAVEIGRGVTVTSAS